MYRRMSPPPADAETAQLEKLAAFSQRFFFNLMAPFVGHFPLIKRSMILPSC
jgi:hypothetical protein